MGRNTAETLAQEERRAEVARLYLRGWTQTRIAEFIGVAQPTVSKDLKALQQAWRDAALRDFDEAKARELARLDEVEREAWDAYQRTVGEHVIRTEGVTAGPNGGPYEKSVTEDLAGNPAFLNIVTTCIERRCKLLGIDAPQKIEQGEPGSFAALPASTREALEAQARQADAALAEVVPPAGEVA